MGNDRQLAGVQGAKIKVFGVGGGGGNAVNTMIKAGLEGVDFYTANTDVQALKFSLAPHKIQLGKELTKGLGAGADPDVGRDAALEDRLEIQATIADADMVFITAGMGGGTGTGAAAIVAQIAREMGALTVAVVTKPFQFEGKRRRKHADMGIARLRECVDTLITIPNQRLLQIATPDLSMIDAFKMADNVLVNAVKGISDIINIPGTVNVDFADVKTVMSCMGHALMGIGYAEGEDRALVAARQAVSSPLLEDVDIEGATGILINITAGASVSLLEINDACSIVQEAAHEDANIIFGAVIDESIGDGIRVTVIATGFPSPENDDKDYAARPVSSTKKVPTLTSHLSGQKVIVPAREDIKSEPVVENLEAELPEIPVLAVTETAVPLVIELPPSQLELSKDIVSEVIQQQLDFFFLKAGKVEVLEPHPLVFDDNLDIIHGLTDSIEKQIDDALSLAESFKADEVFHTMDDDLEIPAFLRNGSAELPHDSVTNS